MLVLKAGCDLGLNSDLHALSNTYIKVDLCSSGPDHSQHSRLWGVIPARYYHGYLYGPGVTDVSNIRSYRSHQQGRSNAKMSLNAEF